jgi:hypothetical protein
MAGGLFRTRTGISINDVASIIYVDSAPGASGLSSSIAPGAIAIGSSGSPVQGKIYQKLLSGTGTDKWQQLVSQQELSAALAAQSGAFDPKASVRVATTTNLVVTAAGTGVGKTLTADDDGAIVIDGVTLALNDRVLVKDQTTGSDNGIYYVSDIGSISSPYVLTRATDADANAKVTAGMFTFTEEGTVNADKGYILVTNNPITVDTTSLTFSVFSTAGGLGALQAEVDAIEVSLGSAINANGTFAGFSGTNHIDGATSFTSAITLLDGEIGADPVANARTNNPIVAGANLNDNIEKLDDAIGSDSSLSPLTRTVGQLTLANSVYGNLDQLDSAIGADSDLSPIPRTSGQLSLANSVLANLEQIDSVIGSDVTPQVRTNNPIAASNSINDNIDNLDSAIGGNVTSTNYASTANSVNDNISALDVQVKSNSDKLDYLSTKSVTAIPGGSFVTVASINVNDYQQGIFKVLVKETGAPQKVGSMTIHALHNKSTGDATEVDATDSNELKFASNTIAGLDYSVELLGTGLAQTMVLKLSTTNASTATVYKESLAF